MGLAQNGQILFPALSAGSGLLSSAASIYNTNRTIQANKQMAEYQYSKDLEMWEKANQYNSPEAQMQRLKTAGLNPNMVYGSGNAVQRSAELPKYQAPRQEYNYKMDFDALGILNAYQDARMKSAQVDVLREQKKNMNQRTFNEMLKSRIYMTDTELKNLDLAIKSKLQQNTIDAAIARLESQTLSNKLLDQQFGLRAQQGQYVGEKIKTEQYRQQQILADTIYRKNQNEWMEMGVTSSDGYLVRMLAQWAASEGITTIPDGIDKLWELLMEKTSNKKIGDNFTPNKGAYDFWYGPKQSGKYMKRDSSYQNMTPGQIFINSIREDFF